MRHPHPILYWIGFGSLVLIGVINALRFWHSQPADASLVKAVLVMAVMAVLPVLSVIMVFALLGCGLLYLGAYRPGNRIRITGGQYSGNSATVTRREGVGMLHVRIDGTDTEVQIPDWHCRGTGWKWFLR